MSLHTISWYQAFIRQSLARIEAAAGKLDTALYYIGKQSEFGKLIFSWLSVIDTRDVDLLVVRANTLALLADDIEHVSLYPSLGLAPMTRKLVHKRRLSRTELESLRFELGVGVDLSRAGVAFTKGESPDFSLRDGCGLECTSSRMLADSSPQQSYHMKICRAVATKAKMPYASRNLCLCVDLSPLVSDLHATLGGFSKAEAEAAIHEAGGDVLGTVILVTTILSKQTDTIARHFLRFDRPGMTPVLRKMVDTVYPMKGHSDVIWHPQIPRDF